MNRREFLRSVAVGGSFLVASELGFLGWLMAREKRGEPNNLGVPEGTHLENLPWGGFSWTDYDVPTLVRMNGHLNGLENLQNTKVIWAPKEVDGEFPQTREALRFLQNHLVFRAVGEHDEENDSGWRSDDQAEMQNILHPTVERVLDFFGGDPLWLTGFIPVYRPGVAEREVIKKTFNMKDPRGGVFGNMGIDGKSSLYIGMLLGDNWRGLKDYSPEEQTRFRAYLGHEIAHAVVGSKLKLPPFNTHLLVDLAGRAFYFDQFRGQDNPTNLTAGIEAKPWMLIKTLTGKDFYAELLQRLFAKHGRASLGFSEEQVMEEGEEIFLEAGAPLSLKTMLDDCPTGICAYDSQCPPNYYCVNAECVPEAQLDISGH